MADARIPQPFPPHWVSDWGQDRLGLWIAFTYKEIRQSFRWISPGRFVMGSPENEAERDNDELQHEVILTRGFWLAETACTQVLWQAVMGNNPSRFRGDRRPVENVSWGDAQEFIQRLNSEQLELDLQLPTEAEWEYACRAGTTTIFSFGDALMPKQANYNGNSPYAGGAKGEYREETVDVKELYRNDWGLYQMHGNVWEWCCDWYAGYSEGIVIDPTGPERGDSRVLRGGSWITGGRRLRSADRGRGGPGARDGRIGFRLARGQRQEGRQGSEAGPDRRSGA